MNSTLCRTNTTDAIKSFFQDTINTYATRPMIVLKPLYQQPDEEVLHTSFEEAISGRLLTLQSRLQHISKSGLIAQNALFYDQTPAETLALAATPPTRKHNQPSQVWRTKKKIWQHRAICTGLAIICVLLGFDLMGLLVLYMH